VGQLTRILLLLLGVWLIVYIVRRARSRKEGASGPSPTRMVACAVCGTHVPDPEAVHAGGKAYCTEAHRKMAEKA